jgi:hypothetical protein
MDISVRFKTKVPDDATPEEIEEWLKFRLYIGDLSVLNRIGDMDMVAIGRTIYWQKAE